MLSHYTTYVLVGGAYYFVLAAFATVASSIGWQPTLAIVGAVALLGFASPLAILRNPFGPYVALFALALLAPWVFGWASLILFAPDEPAAFALVAVVPFGAATYASVAALRGNKTPKFEVPKPLTWTLALVPFSIVILGIAQVLYSLAS